MAMPVMDKKNVSDLEIMLDNERIKKFTSIQVKRKPGRPVNSKVVMEDNSVNKQLLFNFIAKKQKINEYVNGL